MNADGNVMLMTRIACGSYLEMETCDVKERSMNVSESPNGAITSLTPTKKQEEEKYIAKHVIVCRHVLHNAELIIHPVWRPS